MYGERQQKLPSFLDIVKYTVPVEGDPLVLMVNFDQAGKYNYAFPMGSVHGYGMKRRQRQQRTPATSESAKISKFCI